MEGNRLRKLRMNKRLSLNKLSQLTGISKSYLSFLERDIKTNPSIVILKKLAETLNVDIENLIDGRIPDREEKMDSERRLLTLQIELSEEKIDQEKYERLKELLEILKKQ